MKLCHGQSQVIIAKIIFVFFLIQIFWKLLLFLNTNQKNWIFIPCYFLFIKLQIYIIFVLQRIRANLQLSAVFSANIYKMVHFFTLIFYCAFLYSYSFEILILQVVFLDVLYYVLKAIRDSPTLTFEMLCILFSYRKTSPHLPPPNN